MAQKTEVLKQPSATDVRASRELLEDILVELRVLNHYIYDLSSLKDSPEMLREEFKKEI